MITILVRARRELGDVMQRAVREVDKLTQAETKRADVERKTAAATAVTRKSVDDLNKSYTDYLKRLEKGDADVKSATKQLGFFSAEFDKLARKAGAGTKAADDLLKLSRNAKTAAEEITKAGKVQQAQIEASYRQAAEMEAGFRRLADDRADREAQANEREKRRLKDREFFWKEALGAIVEDERRSAADRIEISRAEHEDFERQSRSRIETQQLEAKKIADIEASITRHSSRIEGERVKIINARQAAEEKAAAAQRRADDAEAERARKRADAARDLSNEIHRTMMQYDDLMERIRTRDVGGDDAKLLARQLSQRFRALERPAVTTFGVGSPEAGAAGGGVLRSQQLLKDLEPQKISRIGAEAERATSRVSGLTGALHRLFRVDPGRTEAINDAIEGIENKLAAASYNAVHFAGTLRALVYVGVVVFFNELVSGAIALAGALTTVASTAIQAGTALGGSLAAGAAQALPVIGLLAAAWGRVGAVFKAVKQNIKQHTQASKESSDAAERQREAAKGVADAQQRLRLAQQGLNVAIKEGRREWEDIMSAERSAQLQSERSTLSQRQSRAAFNQALRSGDISATADLSLRVREADFDAEGAATRLARAQEDASTARRTGPRGLPSVVAARRSVQEAREALKEARIEARNAVEQISAADTQLQQMLADLSPVERQLYEVLNRVVARYREVFTGPGGVLEPIIEAFTFGAQRVLDLLDDSRLIDAARRLSDQIAAELRRGFSFLSDESSRDFIVTMSEQARRNLPTITTLATQLVRIGEALARAGGPALSRFLDFFTVLATRGAAATGSGSGIDRLTAFFLKGEEYAEDIVNLTGAIGGLFAAIVGSAAGQGQGVILSITDSIKDATRWINDHQREVHEFFSDALRASASIAHALVVLARGLFSLFDADQVVAFSNAFTHTFVPAVIAVLGVIGALNKAFLALAGSGPGSTIGQFLIIWGGLYKVLTPLVSLFGRLGVNFGKLLGSERIVGLFGGLLTKLGPIGAAIGAITAAMILLDGKLHILHRFNDLFVGVQEKSRIAADKLTDSINKQIEALRRQQDAEERRKASRYSVARAEIAVERARQDVARVEDQINKGELKGRDAELARREATIALKQAKLDEKQARKDLTAAKKDENKADQDAVSKSKGAVDSARGRIDALKDERQVLTERRDEAQRNVDADKQITTDWTLSVEQRQRAMIRLKDDEKVLQQAQDDLNENTRNLRHEGDRSVDAWKRYRKAVRDAGKSTNTFGNIVDDTMDSIVRDVNDVLVEFGAKPLRWKSTRRKSGAERESGASEIFGTPDIGGFPGRQGGGFAVPGHGTGDSVYMQAKVEPGEKVFVLNRNASKVLDGLHSLNRFIPRFAAGGEINWNGHPTNVSAAVKTLLSRLFTRWPDLLVTSTTDHSRLTTSGNVSDHAGGNAVDVASGDYGYMNRVAEWIKSSGLYRSLKQGIHNPNLAVNAGRLQRPPGQFAGAVWAQHANHIHLAIMGTIGRLLGSVAQRVISGPPGRLTDALRGISRRVVRAANSFISRQTSDSTSDENYAGLPTGGDGSRLMRSIARARGWNFNDWWALDASETGHGRNLSNPNSTARLRGQFLNFNWGKYGPGSDPRQSPSMAQQIQAMARYIAERYGSPTAAWAFHRAHNFYAKGGEVAGRLGQAVPIVAHAKEWVVNPVQQGRLATWLGTSISGLKGALGFSGGRGSYDGGGEVQPYQIPLGLGTGSGDITRELGRATRVISGLRSRLISSKFTDALSRSFEAVAGNGGLLDLLSESVASLTTKLDVNLKRATFRITKAGRVIQRLSDAQVIERTIDNLQTVYARLNSEQEAVQKQLDGVGRRLKERGLSDGERAYLQGVEKNLRDRLTTIRSAVADNLQSQFAAVESAIQARVEESQKRFEARTRVLDLQTRSRAIVGATASALLGLPSPAQIAETRAAALRMQAIDVANAARSAVRAGHKETADALFAQVAELNQQAVEAVAQGLRDTTSEIEARFGRETNRIALAGRVADLRERLGDVTGAFAQRGANLIDTGTYTRAQIGELSGLLGRAQARGQTAVAEELRDKIAELNQQLAENEVAIRENTSAARSAAIGAITQRQGFLGGVYSGVTGIVNALGEASGTTDTGSLRQILTAAGGTLAGTGRGLLQQLSEGFGIDLRGQSPQELATSLLGLDYDRIDARLIPADRSTFHDLINSIIENTTATVTNSKQLSDLNDTTTSPQSFSSSFWRVFRRAIFNGAGGLLTQFSEAIPSMAGGGSVLRGGMVNVHAGERIVAAQVVRDGADGDTYITNNITTPTEVLDPTDAARQMAHSYRNRIKR